MQNLHFKNLKDLKRLPYFKLVNGSLQLRENILEYKIIDFHTHLGWHYLFTRKIDLWAGSPVRHFFSGETPLHLERYSALDFTARDRQICQREVMRGAFNSRGYSSTHTISNILKEMDMLKVEKSLLLSIDFPILSNNTEEILAAVNKEKESRKRLPVFASLHPWMWDMESALKKYIKEGTAGLKVHTQMQLFKPSSPRAFKMYELAQKYRLPVLFHTGLSPLSPQWQRRFVMMEDFEKAIAAFPKVTFILGHAGGMGGEVEAGELMSRYKNVYLEISGQPPQIITSFLQKLDYQKILYGSDWAFYPMVLPLAKALIASEKMKKMRKFIFRENAKRLLNRGNKVQ